MFLCGLSDGHVGPPRKGNFCHKCYKYASTHFYDIISHVFFLICYSFIIFVASYTMLVSLTDNLYIFIYLWFLLSIITLHSTSTCLPPQPPTALLGPPLSFTKSLTLHAKSLSLRSSCYFISYNDHALWYFQL